MYKWLLIFFFQKLQKQKIEINTLYNINSNPSKKINAIGSIIDATYPQKTYKSENYVVKIRIIDESLNMNISVSNKKKYINLFIYCKSLSEAPKVS